MTHRSERPLSWWLETGSETCVGCGHAFHPEAGHFCVACDRWVCGNCAEPTARGRELLCPDCFARASTDKRRE